MEIIFFLVNMLLAVIVLPSLAVISIRKLMKKPISPIFSQIILGIFIGELLSYIYVFFPVMTLMLGYWSMVVVLTVVTLIILAVVWAITNKKYPNFFIPFFVVVLANGVYVFVTLYTLSLRYY